MPQPAVLLDTDILSELLKQHPLVVQRVRAYLAEHDRLAFSIITRYELLRGLKAKQATTQEAAFTLLCQACLILPLTDQVVDRAATLYGELHRQGALLPDADLLIAATALEAQRTLVTNNLAHFQRVPHLVIETWKR
ncbi:MAG: type II toxin-antitoxin system VapC family toxin [Nitrospira sp. CG24A]|nr:MAG: type II toxin-antitoxin system VapC family toxin [Nitrospira sp. CG24A]